MGRQDGRQAGPGAQVPVHPMHLGQGHTPHTELSIMNHKKPSRWWYLVALLLPIGGCGATAFQLFNSLPSTVGAFQRVVVPGQGTLQLDTGAYTLFWENQSRVDGELLIAANLQSRCLLTGPSGMVPI